MPLSLGPLSAACGWFLSALQIWSEGETKTANGSISRDLSPCYTPTSAEVPWAFSRGSLGTSHTPEE